MHLINQKIKVSIMEEVLMILQNNKLYIPKYIIFYQILFTELVSY